MAVDMGTVSGAYGFRWVTWYDTFAFGGAGIAEYRISDGSRHSAKTGPNQFSVIIGPYLSNTTTNRVTVSAIDANGKTRAEISGPAFTGTNPIYKPPLLEEFGLDGPVTGSKGRAKGKYKGASSSSGPDSKFQSAPTEFRVGVNGNFGPWSPVEYSGKFEDQEFFFDITGMTPGIENTVTVEMKNGIGTSSQELTVTTEPQHWIRGTVEDEDGAPAFNTPILIEDPATGISVEVVTDEDGNFEVEVPDGTYDLTPPPSVTRVIGCKDVRTA